MRFIFACVAALLLAGCASSPLSLSGSSGPVERPKTIIVTDFAFGDVTAIDRAYTARLERKIGSFPPHERKPRTLERVNEEIVANVVASLRGAGLDAQPGGADGVAAGDGMVLVSGTLRSTEPAPSDSKKPRPVSDQIGFGTGRLAAGAARQRAMPSRRRPTMPRLPRRWPSRKPRRKNYRPKSKATRAGSAARRRTRCWLMPRSRAG